MTTLTFQNTTLSVINQQNQIWLTVTEIGKALGYSDPFKSIKNLYERHQDEFTPNMTALIEMPTAGGIQKIRMFSLRGTHLIAMFSHTKVAKDFRKWVLDILDKEVSQNTQQMLPPERIINLEMPESDALRLASLWFALYKCRETLNTISEPLTTLGSRLGSMAYTQATEYYNVLETTKQIIEPILDGIQSDDGHYQLALDTLRNHQIKRISRLAIR